MKKVNGTTLLAKRMPIIKTREAELSVELTKHILDYCGISSTDEAILEYLEKRYLCKASLIADTTEYSKYPYSIKSAYLINMLLWKG